MKKYNFIVAIVFNTILWSQDLRGTWINVNLDSNTTYDDIILTSKDGNNYDGTSVDEDIVGGYCYFKHNAIFDPETKMYIGEDYELIDKSETHVGCDFRLRYVKDGKREYLIGQIYLKQRDGTASYPVPVKYMREIPEVSEADKAIVETYRKTRTNKQIANIKIPIKDLKIKVYDYGQVDNDTITIFYNNNLVAHKIPIDSEVDNLELELDVNAKEHKLYFVANNVGKIPPNTTRIEIEVGEKKYEYTLFTTDKKNAMIVFAPIWKKEEITNTNTEVDNNSDSTSPRVSDDYSETDDFWKNKLQEMKQKSRIRKNIDNNKDKKTKPQIVKFYYQLSLSKKYPIC